MIVFYNPLYLKNKIASLFHFPFSDKDHKNSRKWSPPNSRKWKWFWSPKPADGLKRPSLCLERCKQWPLDKEKQLCLCLNNYLRLNKGNLNFTPKRLQRVKWKRVIFENELCFYYLLKCNTHLMFVLLGKDCNEQDLLITHDLVMWCKCIRGSYMKPISIWMWGKKSLERLFFQKYLKNNWFMIKMVQVKDVLKICFKLFYGFLWLAFMSNSSGRRGFVQELPL